MRRHRRNQRPVAEINMTSLLDVAFVLLIAFMMVAPSLKYGVEIDLPEINASTTPLPGESPNTTVISIKANPAGDIIAFYLDGKEMTITALEEELRILNEASGKQLKTEVQTDGHTRHEPWIQVMNAIQRAGIQGVALPVTVSGR